jgi:hypothetical protein
MVKNQHQQKEYSNEHMLTIDPNIKHEARCITIIDG